MNRSQLIKIVAEKSTLSQKQIGEICKLLESTMLDTLVAGKDQDEQDKIQLSGFGTFEVRTRAAREGRNPKTGETVSIPACRYVVFVPAKAVKEKLN